MHNGVYLPKIGKILPQLISLAQSDKFPEWDPELLHHYCETKPATFRSIRNYIIFPSATPVYSRRQLPLTIPTAKPAATSRAITPMYVAPAKPTVLQDNLDISGTRIPASDDNVPDQRYEPTLVNPGSCSDSAFEARRQAFPGPDSPRLDQGPQVKQANGVETDSRTHTIEVNYKPSHLHTASMKDSRHDNHTKNFLKDARHVFDDSDLYDGAGDDGNTNWFVDLQPVAQPEKKRGRPPGINVRIKTKKKKKKWSLEATLGVVDIDTCLAKVKFLSLTPPPIHTRDPPEQATTVRLEQSALWFTVHPCRAIRRKYLRFIDDPLANNKDLGNQLSSVMASSSRPLPPPL